MRLYDPNHFDRAAIWVHRAIKSQQDLLKIHWLGCVVANNEAEGVPVLKLVDDVIDSLHENWVLVGEVTWQ